MSDFPETRESLLVQVRSPANREAWDQFALIYRPVIYRLARHRGLQDADAQDLAQQVLIAVASAIGNWQKSSEEVRFHHWLRRVARNAIVNALLAPPARSRGRAARRSMNCCRSNRATIWSRMLKLNWSIGANFICKRPERVRGDIEPTTWRAFEMTVVENRSIDEAAIELDKPIGSIYAARSRVMRRLREAVRELERAES